MALTDKLTAIAEAIRSKTGKAATMTLDEMPTEIAGIETGGSEDLNAILTEQEALIAELEEVLKGKAAGGGGGVDNYVKFIVIPTSTTSITIENPLGGIAKCFTIRRLSDTAPSSQKVYECVGSYNPPLGAFEFASTTTTVRYPIQRTDGSIGNATFKITEGEIQVYRYNTANTWDTTSEYEVEIWQ